MRIPSVSQLFITIVYISPSADVDVAACKIHDVISDLETSSPDAVKLVLGDFNQCELRNVLPNYHQYVDMPTRGDCILDKCYGNVHAAYKTVIKAGLGSSDHDIVQQLPKYVQRLKQTKPHVKVTKEWSQENTEVLRACFECTDWEVFTASATLDEATEAISAYINFCQAMVIPEKMSRIYPNSKPWVRHQLKGLLREKQAALRKGDTLERKRVQHRIKKMTVKCKKEYANEVEQRFRSGSIKQVWDSMKKMSGYDKNCPG